MVGASKYTPEEKAQFVMLALRTPEKLAELCREKGISPVSFSRWKRTYTSGGMEALRTGGRTLHDEVQRQNELYLKLIGKLYTDLEIQKKRLELGP